MQESTVTAKGQTTLPKQVRSALDHKAARIPGVTLLQA